MAFDTFAAALQCPICGTRLPQPDATEIQTSLRLRPSYEFLKAGDRIEMVEPEQAGYFKVRDRGPGEPYRLLHLWQCPRAHYPVWAEAVIAEDGLIETIEASPADRQTLERVQYIQAEIVEWFEGTAGEPLFVASELRPNWIERLLTTVHDWYANRL